MGPSRKLAVGCGCGVLLVIWGALSLLGLGAGSLTFHDLSEFRAPTTPEGFTLDHAWVVVDGIEVYGALSARTAAWSPWGFPFVTLAEDTDTHYVNVAISTPAMAEAQFAQVVRVELVTADATFTPRLEPPAQAWQRMAVTEPYYAPSEVSAGFHAPDGVHIPRAVDALRFVVEFRVRRGAQEITRTVEIPFRRFTWSRPPYVSMPT